MIPYQVTLLISYEYSVQNSLNHRMNEGSDSVLECMKLLIIGELSGK